MIFFYSIVDFKDELTNQKVEERTANRQVKIDMWRKRGIRLKITGFYWYKQHATSLIIFTNRIFEMTILSRYVAVHDHR